ncbi:MAG: glycoside hydrolase family 3 protein [Tissierellia bacterium]|nr:glycoside hydrolase family 3 protein [Tissierellia bacterium]
MRKLYLFLISIVLLLLCSCVGNEEKIINTDPAEIKERIIKEPEPLIIEPIDEKSKAEILLEGMTLREKVGQLFIVRPEALNFSLEGDFDSKSISLQMETSLKDYPVGGFIMADNNLDSPDQVANFINDLQAVGQIPLFISVDEEGGPVSRLANHPNFDLKKYRSAANVGKSGKYEDAYEMGATIGEYLNKYGFNLDFAPVADVNTNPNNPVIGSRAFSSDPELVALMAGAFADALRDKGIIPTFKHFPGHGDTREDSHKELAISYKTEDELKACEFIPFQSAGEDDLLMVGHIALPNVTGNNTPATMSKKIVSDILKGTLNFKGLVVTDALEMKTITSLYDPSESAVKALEAGCDILLMPADLRQAFDGIVKAVDEGRYSEEDLDKKVLGILNLKEKLLLTP